MPPIRTSTHNKFEPPSIKSEPSGVGAGLDSIFTADDAHDDRQVLPYRSKRSTAGSTANTRSTRTQPRPSGTGVPSQSDDAKTLSTIASDAPRYLSLDQLHALDLEKCKDEKMANCCKTQRVYMATAHHTKIAMTNFDDWQQSLIRDGLFTEQAKRTDAQKAWLRLAANSDLSLLPSEVWNDTDPLPYVHLLKTQEEVSCARRVKVAGLGSSTAARHSYGTGSVVSHVWASSRNYRRLRDMCDLVSATVEPDRRRGDLQSALEMMEKISPDDPYEQPSGDGSGPFTRLGSVAYKMGTHLTRGFHIDVTPETLHRIGADRV